MTMKYLIEFRDAISKEPIEVLDTTETMPPYEIGDYIYLGDKNWKITMRQWYHYHKNELSLLFIYLGDA